MNYIPDKQDQGKLERIPILIPKQNETGGDSHAVFQGSFDRPFAVGIFLVVAGILDALANIIFVLICMSVFILFNYQVL